MNRLSAVIFFLVFFNTDISRALGIPSWSLQSPTNRLITKTTVLREQPTFLAPPIAILPQGTLVEVAYQTDTEQWVMTRSAYFIGWMFEDAFGVSRFPPLRLANGSAPELSSDLPQLAAPANDVGSQALLPAGGSTTEPALPVDEGAAAMTPTATTAMARRPSMMATLTREALILDGRVDEPAWRSAVATDAFTQKFPLEGQSPSERTTLRVLYDDEALYISFVCDQRQVPVVRRMTRRDRQEESDWVSVNIGTRRDGTSAFEFMVSAAGVLADGIRFDDTEYSADWDDVWDARVQMTNAGWSAEIRIPLQILRFDPLPDQSWDFQARRYVSALQETEEWALIPRSEAGEVSHYGLLGNLVGLRAKHALELRPYAVARAQWDDGALPLQSPGPRFAGLGGLDLKWHITPNLTLNGTLNPDFAQVEVDRVLLNLSNYEVVFPEKRPFMLEGMDTFATPLTMLYTRRIGTAPPLVDGVSFTERPGPSPIYGALKLVGTVKSRLTIGLLSALTGQNDSPIATGGQGLQSLTLDQLALFNALRLKLQIGKNAHLGLFGGSVTRFEGGAQYRETPKGNGDAGVLCPDGIIVSPGTRCSHDAFVLSMDGRWRSANGTYLISGQGVLTALNGGPPRPQRDGTVLQSGDVSFGGIVKLAKEAGAHWSAFTEAEVNGSTLDYNDLGYMRRQNLARITAQVEVHTLRPWWLTNETRTWLQFVDQETLAGLNLAREGYLGTRWRFANYWSTSLELYHRASHFDDREVGNGVAMERTTVWGGEINLTSDPRRRVVFETAPAVHYLPTGYNVFWDATLTVRALSWLELQLTPEVMRYAGEPRYVGPGSSPASYLFGRLYATSMGTTIRGTLSFTPRLTLQGYAQLFLAARHYQDFSVYQATSVTAKPAVRLADLQPAALPPTTPDSQETVLNISAVLRWEFRPGSTLYAVYSRAHGAPLQGQPASLDLAAIGAGAAANSFVLKLSYWWN